VVTTVPTTLYQEFTPQNAVTGAIDYQRPFDNFTLRAHLDGNWDSGSYGTDRDPAPGVLAIKSQPGLVFNGRIALGDIQVAQGSRLTLSLWARNLFDEQHLYTRSFSPTSGIGGVFNDPRTFGVEGRASF
jgi:iron complex outermembrane receptor protein